jgi:glycosyltransferase involved in cell wall biosynthesis
MSDADRVEEHGGTGHAPRVSVILPTRNRVSMLKQALRSVLEQEGVDLEVIVIDEASADETPAELRRISDWRLVVIRNDAPKGVAAARNAAIDVARGEWIAFLDDDDVLAPDNFRMQLARAGSDQVVLLYSGRVEVDEELSPQHLTPARDPQDLARRMLIGNVVGPPSGVLVRADALDSVGGFDESFSALADWDLWIRVAELGSAAISPEPLLAYRRHPGSMTVARADEVLEEFERLRRKHRKAAEAAGIEFGGNFVAPWRAGRDLAEGRRLRAARTYTRLAIAERRPRDALRALAALGGRRIERLGRAVEARGTPRPEWLQRYA